MDDDSEILEKELEQAREKTDEVEPLHLHEPTPDELDDDDGYHPDGVEFAPRK